MHISAKAALLNELAVSGHTVSLCFGTCWTTYFNTMYFIKLYLIRATHVHQTKELVVDSLVPALEQILTIIFCQRCLRERPI